MAGTKRRSFSKNSSRMSGAACCFDASNAVCAYGNIGLPLEKWDRVIASNHHFHVAGYRNSMIEPYVRLDTHAEALAPDTIEFLSSRRNLFDKEGATMTYERDNEIHYDDIVADLARLRAIFPKEEVALREPALATA